RLVEAVELLDLLDFRRVHPLAAAVARESARAGGAPTGLAAARIAPLKLRHHLLYRAARNELDHDEGDEQDAEQRREHEQQPLEDVRPHLLFSPPGADHPVVGHVIRRLDLRLLELAAAPGNAESIREPLRDD